MNFSFYKDSIRRHGALPTLCHAAYRAANQVGRLAVWNAVAVAPDEVDKRYLVDAPAQRRGRMLEAAAMRRHIEHADNLLTDAFVDRAIVRGDRCYASFDGDRLTSYAWYTTRPAALTEIDGNLVLHFDPSYAYMYNAYTLPRYRGRGLNAFGMAAAVDALTEEGRRGVLAYVDSTNFAAASSCARVGYKAFGRVVVFKVGGRYVCRSSAGCGKYDFRVVQA
jgi:ribosomal protein S18 acetylase RimI-like enzyme